MYKLLLCWRYLKTRYIALASIVSVTLGVATMIVVNSVMSGFAHEMQSRIQGILSDVVVESLSAAGAPNAERHMQEIRRAVGDYVEGMTPTIHTIGVLTLNVRGQTIYRQVTVIGIDEGTHAQASDFSQYLTHPGNREKMRFDLREGGFDARDREGGEAGRARPALGEAGWPHRRKIAERDALYERLRPQSGLGRPPGESAPEGAAARHDREPVAYIVPPEEEGTAPQIENEAGHAGAAATLAAGDAGPHKKDPFAIRAVEQRTFDPAKQTYTGIVLGMGLVGYRDQEGADRFLVLPGEDVQIAVPRNGASPKPYDTMCTVVDLYESKMSEYDSSFVFVPIEELQKWRGMLDRQTGDRFVNSIQIKLKDGADADLVRDKLRAVFPAHLYAVQTWRDKQGPLLSAVQMETAILNVLLFLIIAVAGFGILAIFYMIVVEKTRDVGILKSLGASGRGIMGIFLGYGLSLGAVGSGAGLAIGLLFVAYINEIADRLGAITGQNVFDPAVYYFYRIPTIVEPATLAWIVSGAVSIAVLASVLPARRAARLHPVEALRYE